MTTNAETLEAGGRAIGNTDFSRSVTALFDRADHAEKARQDLMAAGIHADAITLLGDGARLPETAAGPAPGGFWEALKDLFMPEEDADQFAEGVRRGGVTVAVRTDTANHDRILDILDRDGAVDLDERQESWRNDGWTGYTARDPLVEARSPSLAIGADNEDMGYAPPSAGTAGFGASAVDRFPLGGDVAPEIQSPGALPPSALEAATEPPNMGGGDRLAGTRDLSHGRLRVRSYQWRADSASADDPLS